MPAYRTITSNEEPLRRYDKNNEKRALPGLVGKMYSKIHSS